MLAHFTDVNSCESGFIVIQILFSEGQQCLYFASSISNLPVEAVLCIRTWAVWRRDKVIGIGLAVLMLAYVVSLCILSNRFIRSVECKYLILFVCIGQLCPITHAGLVESPPFPGIRGCFTIKPPKNAWETYVPATVVQCGK